MVLRRRWDTFGARHWVGDDDGLSVPSWIGDGGLVVVVGMPALLLGLVFVVVVVVGLLRT